MADAPLTIMDLPPATRLSIRAEQLAAILIGAAVGVTLSDAVCRAETAGGRSALWLGPDEWLLVAPDDDGGGLLAAQAIAAAGGDAAASVVDVSDGYVGISVSGPKAAEAINAFNPLDLDANAFPVGMCTRTIFGKAEILLWRTSLDGFRIEVGRSLAPYVVACLEEAGREYGVGPAAGTRSD